jgi:aminomethyltransferase
MSPRAISTDAARDSPRSLLLRVDAEGVKPAQGALVHHNRRREVSHITSGVWSPTAKRNIALAHVTTAPARARPARLWPEICTLQERK